MIIHDDRLRKALQYCVYQERCQQEVRYKLIEIGYRYEELEDVMAYLITENYLNESRFSALYAVSKLRNNHWGRKKIVLQLKQKAISEYNIKYALREIDNEEYNEILRKVMTKKYDELIQKNDKFIAKQKLINFVLNKGFEYEELSPFIKELFQ